MLSITLAWTTHELAIYSYNAFHLLTDLFYPITKDQLKILGLYYTEESIKSIMTGDELQVRYATFEKSNFRIAKFLNLIPGSVSYTHLQLSAGAANTTFQRFGKLDDYRCGSARRPHSYRNSGTSGTW